MRAAVPVPLLASALLGLAALAVWVQVSTGTGLAAWDAPVEAWVVEHRVAALTGAVQLVTDTAARPVVVVTGVATTAVLLLARRWWAAAAAAGTSVLAQLLTTELKTATGRARPPADDVLGAPLTSWSFPSGHALQGTVSAALVAAVLVLLVVRGRRARTVVVVLAATEALAVGLSRVYLGHHWLTDVVAGWLVAGALLALAAPAVLRRSRADG